MLYLINEFDLDIFIFEHGYLQMDMWETTEENVRSWIENERSRSIFDKQEIINLFKPKHKIQMIQVDKIPLKAWDKIVLFTKKKKYYAIKILGYKT